jgi:hypothetical protein
MSSLKETDKRARMVLSVSAFDYINRAPRKSYTREQLFSVDYVKELSGKGYDKTVTFALTKELGKPKWQDAVLELASASGILEKGRSIAGENVYCVADEALLSALLADCDDGSLVLLGALVFPHLTPGFENMLLVKVGKVSESPPTTEEPEEELEEEPEETADIPYKTFQQISTALNDILNVQKQFMGIQKEESARLGELEKKAGGANKRTEALDKSIVELAAAVRKSCAISEQTHTSLDVLLKEDKAAIAQLDAHESEQAESLRKSVNTLAEQVTALTEHVVGLTEIVKRNNSTATLVARLENHLSEGETLKELMISNLGDNHEPTRRTKATVRKRSE